jgi:hypothetical protein
VKDAADDAAVLLLERRGPLAPRLEGGKGFGGQVDDPPFPVLRRAGIEPDGATVEIDLPPFQVQEFTAAEAAPVGQGDEGPGEIVR